MWRKMDLIPEMTVDINSSQSFVIKNLPDMYSYLII